MNGYINIENIFKNLKKYNYLKKSALSTFKKIYLGK